MVDDRQRRPRRNCQSSKGPPREPPGVYRMITITFHRFLKIPWNSPTPFPQTPLLGRLAWALRLRLREVIPDHSRLRLLA